MAADGSCPVMSRMMDDALDDESPYAKGQIADDDPDFSELHTDEELDVFDRCDGWRSLTCGELGVGADAGDRCALSSSTSIRD